MTEENNEIWMLRSARLDQQPTVQKLLKEGFEPFWGTTVTVDKNGEKEKVIRMYFRKSPVQIAEAVEQQSINFNLEPLEEFTNQFRSSLSGVLDSFIDNFFGKLDDREKIDVNVPAMETKLFTPPTAQPKNKEDDEPVIMPEDESINDDNQPAGDGYRVVDDIPEEVIAVTHRTTAQDSAIEGLRSQGNVTILPGLTDAGSVRVMIGADMYTIERDGNFTVEKTGAGTDSTLVGG